MRLEQEPGPLVVWRRNGVFGPIRVVTSKFTRHAEDKQIRLVILGDAGAGEKADDGAVGGIEAFALTTPLVEELVALGLAYRRAVERGVNQEIERLFCLGDHADLIAILKVPTDAVKLDAQRDIELFEILLRPDT